MSSPESSEIHISLTPQQAASGTVLRLPSETGVPPVRIPPVRDGDLVRLRAGERELLLRVHVTASGTTTAAQGAQKRGIACLGVLGVAVVVVLLVVLTNRGGDGSSDDSADGSSYSPSASATTYDPYTRDPATGDPYESSAPSGTGDPYGTGAPYGGVSEEPSPFTSGTCLNGTLPTSTTAQEVSGVEEVSCSASDAHYKVIETIPFSTDMSRCNSNPRTQYAFSYRYTLNGAAVNEYVYCLVGLGSYAR
ncbi:hypothetical protein J2Z21_007093 [Streptomyces griseochromogenes]|uniref:Uncharacterized protein n=1 Tax=Streptomyces griseochromogenes TaxID=68214 RepID=A0A1B1AQ96_9ACTN|nr:hypothetical protein [Streptomyces griseochromogenes]ANP48751.1 hypothetical protein AVL59_03445 [Streptomyces griseochromogenes]MBP2054091.1 hypothetical protein [Streptomyces griseochromogenes]